PSLMSETRAASLVRAAWASGIRVFDTAPGYGLAESRLGEMLRPEAEVWTKVDRRGDAAHDVRELTRTVVEQSRRRRRRDQLGCVQWHNFEADWLGEQRFLDALEVLRSDPAVRSVGVTTYGVENADAAVRSGLFARVQVEWNLLNQGVVRAIRAD